MGPKPLTDPLVSVIIVDYNAGDLLTRCIASLERQTYPFREIIVIDNQSSDGSGSACKEAFPKVKYVRPEKNLGFAGGCNMGARLSQGEILFLLNPDTEADPELLATIVRRLVDDPSIGVLGAKIFDPGWHVIQHAGGILSGNALTSHIGRGEPDQGQFDEAREYPYVTGAAFAMRRDVASTVGLLDPYYVPAYFEETDLCFRVRRHGFRIVYEPRARVVHHEGTASVKGSARFFYIYHRNRLRFVLRNYPLFEILGRFLPAELRWMKESMPKEQHTPLARAYATNVLRLPLTILGF